MNITLLLIYPVYLSSNGTLLYTRIKKEALFSTSFPLKYSV